MSNENKAKSTARKSPELPETIGRIVELHHPKVDDAAVVRQGRFRYLLTFSKASGKNFHASEVRYHALSPNSARTQAEKELVALLGPAGKGKG